MGRTRGEREEQWEGPKQDEEGLCSYLFCCNLRKTLLLVNYASAELISKAHAEGGRRLARLLS